MFNQQWYDIDTSKSKTTVVKMEIYWIQQFIKDWYTDIKSSKVDTKCFEQVLNQWWWLK